MGWYPCVPLDSVTSSRLLARLATPPPRPRRVRLSSPYPTIEKWPKGPSRWWAREDSNLHDLAIIPHLGNYWLSGAEGGTRTHMILQPLRSERSASTNFATSAQWFQGEGHVYQFPACRQAGANPRGPLWGSPLSTRK